MHGHPAPMSGGHRHGYPFVELVILTAACATIASLVLPLFEERAIRAKVNRGIAAAEPAKLTVAAFLSGDGRQRPATSTIEGGPSRHLARIEFAEDGSGILTVTTRDTGAAPEITIHLIPTVDERTISWQCRHAAGPVRYLPNDCTVSGGAETDPK